MIVALQEMRVSAARRAGMKPVEANRQWRVSALREITDLLAFERVRHVSQGPPSGDCPGRVLVSREMVAKA